MAAGRPAAGAPGASEPLKAEGAHPNPVLLTTPLNTERANTSRPGHSLQAAPARKNQPQPWVKPSLA